MMPGTLLPPSLACLLWITEIGLLMLSLREIQ